MLTVDWFVDSHKKSANFYEHENHILTFATFLKALLH